MKRRMLSEPDVHVLFRFSTKTGKIDTTMTALGSALLTAWALHHTPKTKTCIIIERSSGNVIFEATGHPNGFPLIAKNTGFCEDYDIPLETVQAIKDERFDE